MYGLKGVMSLLIAFISLVVVAQQKDSLTQTPPASKHTSIAEKVKEIGDAEAKRSMLKYQNSSITRRQEELIEGVIKITLEAKDYVKRGLDTAGIRGT